MFEECGGACQYCLLKFPFEKLTLDRIIPGAFGGTYAYVNLILACEDCNQERGSSDFSEFVGYKCRLVPQEHLDMLAAKYEAAAEKFQVKKPETAFWHKMCTDIPKFSRVEAKIPPGIPDVYYNLGFFSDDPEAIERPHRGTGWIENKFVEPKTFRLQPNFPVRSGLTAQQSLWLQDEWKAGGYAWMLIGLGGDVDFWYLIPGESKIVVDWEEHYAAKMYSDESFGSGPIGATRTLFECLVAAHTAPFPFGRRKKR